MDRKEILSLMLLCKTKMEFHNRFKSAYTRAYNLGIIKELYQEAGLESTSKPYSERELDLLRENYYSRGPKWCAERLGRTRESVYTAAKNNKIASRRLDPVRIEKEFRDIVTSRGGLCLFDKWEGTNRTYKVKCKLGHLWFTHISRLRNGGWCRDCQPSSRAELVLRQIMEHTFGVEFLKKRHEFLRNPKTNIPLELDGYSPDLRIGFEYNGAEHHIAWRATNQELDDLKERDKFKLNKCAKEGVKLLVVNWKERERPKNEFLIDAVIKFIEENDIKYLNDPCSVEIDEIKLQRPVLLERLKEAAIVKNLEILEESILDCKQKIRIRCLMCGLDNKNAAISDVLTPQYNNCVNCAGNGRLSLLIIRNRLSGSGVEVLSDEYVNARTEMSFRMPNGRVELLTWDHLIIKLSRAGIIVERSKTARHLRSKLRQES